MEHLEDYFAGDSILLMNHIFCDPENATHWFNLASFYQAQGDANQARQYFAFALTLDPANLDILNALDRGWTPFDVFSLHLPEKFSSFLTPGKKEIW